MLLPVTFLSMSINSQILKPPSVMARFFLAVVLVSPIFSKTILGFHILAVLNMLFLATD
jgi:hypothetical protein